MQRDDKETVLLVRAHYFGVEELRFIDELLHSAQFPVAIVADERSSCLEVPPHVEKISLTLDVLGDLGLLITDDVLWRCGDYALYAARKRFPMAKFFWMIESDVRIHARKKSDLFLFFESAHEIDFLSCRYGIAQPEWWWRGSMLRYYAQVYRCMFPITRFSGRSVDFMLRRRRALASLHLAEGAGSTWPNDEAFAATELTNNGYSCRDFNDFGTTFYTNKTFGFHRPRSLKLLSQTPCDNLIYHPVLSGERFESKLRKCLQSHSHLRVPPSYLLDSYGANALEDLRVECGDEALLRFKNELAKAVLVASAPVGQPTRDLRREPGSIVSVKIDDQEIMFFVADHNDFIQKFHWRGQFYEDTELAAIGSLLRPGSIVIDIGAHVGNHTIYFAHFLKAERIVVIEPNWSIMDILRINIQLNGLGERVDMSCLGVAFGDQEGSGIVEVDQSNTGRAKVRRLGKNDYTSEKSRPCQIVRGDDLLDCAEIHLIKLDVGGAMEVDVLKGLLITIRSNRPDLFVQVSDNHRIVINDLLNAEDYKVIWRHRRHSDGESVMFVPSERAEAALRRVLPT